MQSLTLTVPGKPIAKKRPRFFRRGAFVGTYNAQETEESRWMWTVNQQLPDGFKPITGPVKVFMEFAFPYPKSWSKKKRQTHFWHAAKPDLDNLEKFVLDCLRDFVIADDAAVCKTESVKFWDEFNEPLTKIKIEQLIGE